MLAPVNGVVLMDGTVTSVQFSERKDRVQVEFKDEGNFVFEFSNKKKPRADQVKKMRLRPGEHVIAVGATSGASNAFGYGFDIMRTGKVAEGGYAVLRGTAEKIVKTSVKSLLTVTTEDGKEFAITAPTPMVNNLNPGVLISCLCTISETFSCSGSCKNAGAGKCGSCTKQKKKKKYSAIRINRRE